MRVSLGNDREPRRGGRDEDWFIRTVQNAVPDSGSLRLRLTGTKSTRRLLAGERTVRVTARVAGRRAADGSEEPDCLATTVVALSRSGAARSLPPGTTAGTFGKGMRLQLSARLGDHLAGRTGVLERLVDGRFVLVRRLRVDAFGYVTASIPLSDARSGGATGIRGATSLRMRLRFLPGSGGVAIAGRVTWLRIVRALPARPGQ